MPGPLTDVRILDLGTAGVGPWAACLLGLLGADVIKIESPAGDRHRFQPPLQAGLSTTYTSLNLNKKTAIVDFKDPAMGALRDMLVRQADVVMDNLRPGVVDRLGYGYRAAQAVNPRIISASSPAWGDGGPLRDIPALDPQVQVFSGFAALNGDPDGPPEMLRYPHLDFNASLYFASTVILALIARERNGQGARVTASHLGSSLALQSGRLAELLMAGQKPTRLGGGSAVAAPQGYYLCKDQQNIAIGVEQDRHWASLCQVLGREEWLTDPRYATMRDRVANQVALSAEIAAILRTNAARWWLIQCERAGVPASLTWDFDRLRYHQHLLDNGMITTINPPHQGEMVVGAPPWQFSASPCAITIDGAAPDQHHDEIFARGFGAAAPQPSAGVNGAAVQPPLAGLRVIDATQGVAGPYAAFLLAEAGAEVIKVEPVGGDYARAFAPAAEHGDSALFSAFNRGKRSVTLDLDQPADQARYRDLAATVDLVLEDWGPGVAAGRGLDYAALNRPGLIYGALTGFGERGPLKDLPASELTMQAWSEYWKNLGVFGETPIRVGIDICGMATGAMTAMGLLGAVYHRHRTGQGQRVALSQLGVMMTMRTAQWAAVTGPDGWDGDTYCNNGTSGPRHGYRAADRSVYFSMNNASEEQYLALLQDLGMLDSVIDDERFGNGGRDAVGMGKHSDAVTPVWNEFFGRHDAQTVVDLVNKHGGMSVPFVNPDEAIEHPQVAAISIIQTGPDGKAYVRAPWVGPWTVDPLPLCQPLEEPAKAGR